MSWIETYDAVFFISIGSMVIGLIGLIIKYCLKSKCEHFSLCYGIIKIDRRVDIEAQEEMARIERGLPEDDIAPQQTQTTRRPSHISKDEIPAQSLHKI